MEIQRQGNMAFTQRYVIPYEKHISDAASLSHELKPFFDFVREPHSFTRIDELTKKLYLASGEDEDKFLNSLFNLDYEQRTKENESKMLSDFFDGAIVLDKNKLEELKKPLIDINENYKVNIAKKKIRLQHLRTLNDYLTIIGSNKNYYPSLGLSKAIWREQGVTDALVTIKDADEYIGKKANLEEANIPMGQFKKDSKKMISDYFKTAKRFGKKDDAYLINQVRKILGLENIQQ